MALADLTGRRREDTYKSLLHLEDYTNGLTVSFQQVYDGDGTSCPLWLSTTAVKITNVEITGGTISGTTVSGYTPTADLATVALSNDYNDLDNLPSIPSAYTDEMAQDTVATMIQNGTGITWSYDDASNKLTPTVTITQYTDELAQDAAASLIQNGTGLSWVYDDGLNTLTPTVSLSSFDTDDLKQGATNKYYSSTLFDSDFAGKDTDDLTEGSTNKYFTDERVDDRVAALIKNGTGITWSYDDGLNTLTPTVTITQYTDEMAQDTVATMIQNGTGITWSYDDGNGTLTPTVTITQYTDELAQDAVGGILTDTDTIDFTYDDGTPAVKADVKNDSITFAKIQNIATDKLIGRVSASTGDPEEVTCTDFAQSLLDDSDAATARTTLELGTMAVETAADYSKTSDFDDVAFSGDYDDLTNTPTIPSAIFSKISVSGQDDVEADSTTDTLTFAAGIGMTITTDKTTDTVTFTSSITQYTDEMAQDTVATMIQNGTGITWSYDDGNGTLTPAVTITQYTDELAQDAVGGMIDNGTFVSLTYDDSTPFLKADLSATGTPDNTKFLRGDNTWATPTGSGGASLGKVFPLTVQSMCP